MISRTKIIFVLIVVLLAVVLSLPLQVSRNIKIRLVDLSSPLVEGINLFVGKIFSIKDLFTAVKERKILQEKLDQVSVKLNELKEVQKENERLRGLLDLKKSIPHKTTACRVIARDASTWYKTLIIDKGKSSGVLQDMPVIGNSGVIGRVIESSNDAARVLLITDINSSIGGIIQDARTVGLVEGNGSGGCILNLLSKDIDIPTGSMVVTSGLGEIFPKGLLIGTVTSVSYGGQGLYKVAQLKLACDIDRVEEVLVVSNQKPVTRNQK